MLFKRKKPLTLTQHAKKAFQPLSKWKRDFVYIKHRLLRLPHSTHDIAMGLSAGCVVSWTPTWGLQILQCYVFCKLFRANFLASLLGTLSGNPWTFPILMWISYIVGDFVVSHTVLEQLVTLKTGEEYSEHEGFGVQSFFPMLIGGYIMAFATFPIFYLTFYSLIEGARKTRNIVGKTVHHITHKDDGDVS